jgi:Asp/Glu/hydantoin racemase
MQKIAAVYTGAALLAPLSKELKETLPDYGVINLLDDALIGECIAAGRVPMAVKRRLIAYYQTLAENGACLILNTCSSVGDVVYEARPFVPVPIVRIDDAMCREAVGAYSRIGVIATLPTTLDPTMRLVQRWADRLGRKVEVLNGLAEGAFAALSGGDGAKHDELIRETGKRLADKCDVILFAQASMERMEEPLGAELGMPVFASPKRAIAMVRDILAGKIDADYNEVK